MRLSLRTAAKGFEIGLLEAERNHAVGNAAGRRRALDNAVERPLRHRDQRIGHRDGVRLEPFAEAA